MLTSSCVSHYESEGWGSLGYAAATGFIEECAGGEITTLKFERVGCHFIKLTLIFGHRDISVLLVEM